MDSTLTCCILLYVNTHTELDTKLILTNEFGFQFGLYKGEQYNVCTARHDFMTHSLHKTTHKRYAPLL